MFSKHLKCDDESANQLIHSILKDDLNKTLEKELKQLIADGNIKDLDPSKLKITAQNVKFTTTDSRTDFIDPNSPKTQCSIDLNITIPADLVKKSDEARAKVNSDSVEQQANKLDVSFSNNKIDLVLNYELQPSDSGEKVFAVLKNTGNTNRLVADTLTYAFLKPQIEKNEIRSIEAAKKQAKSTEQAAYEATVAAEDAVVAADAATIDTDDYYSEY
ncbi:hypothetical protein [Acinetobacter shaoyimingii]|uniref:DUF2589 domain-containing protein n=1 Tax=Acinetobacter shaoyimingii TaxID=2715164 RepID=A0A6G8RWX7_9GAMM|nr:hypothetical protein [Acinetobacter shaoyimingii]QIO06308.1 hypothetical protein G8E00_10265 [Acinetobacter shaoyimingii]